MNASKLIDKKISDLKDWRGETLAHLRKVILSADASLNEEYKWNTPVFTSNGNVCALGVFKNHIKINFFNGAKIDDPKKLFNAGFKAKTSRGIDITEGSNIDEKALKDLVEKAVKFNG